MEDLASFIQTLSEKYGLLDFGNDKVDNAGARQKHTPAEDAQNDHGQQNGGSANNLDMDTSWECLTSFLNKHDLQHANMHNSRTKKSSTSRLRELKDHLTHDDQRDDDVEEAQTLNRPGSGSSGRAVSLANTIQTSDLIQNVSFLDELQNPSLSEDLQSTGMTKARDSLDDSDQGQSLLLQEMLVGNGEKNVDLTEFAMVMGLSSFDEDPQKEDATWHTDSDSWFEDFCSKRRNNTSSSQRSTRLGTKVAENLSSDCGLRTHDILTPKDILLSSGSSISPAGTELDAQVDDCHSASASQSGADAVAVVARSRCGSPEGLAAGHESVERGRERSAIANAKVEKMLEEKDSHHGRGGHRAVESTGGKLVNRALEDNGKMSELRFGTSENGSVGSLKQRMADMDEGNRLLLSQLDKSRSLLSPSKQPTLFRSRSSLSDRSEHWGQPAQTRRSNEEFGDRSTQDANVSLRHLNEGGIKDVLRNCQGKVSSPHEHDRQKGASSRGGRDLKSDCRGSPVRKEGFSCHGSKTSYDPDQRRTSSRNLASTVLPVDQIHRLDGRGDSSGDRKIGHNLRIRIPNFQLAADQDDPRSCEGQGSPENQEGINRTRETPTLDRKYSGSLAVSPRDEQSDDDREEYEGGQSSLGHAGRDREKDNGFCARTKKYYNFTSSWEKDWTEVEEEEVQETTKPTPSRTSVRQSKWEQVNNVLSQNGFSTIRCSNILDSHFEEDCHLVLSDIINNYERREKLVQALLEEGDELRQVEDRNHTHIQQLESENDEAKQRIAVIERRAEAAAIAAERNYAALRRDCQKLESSNTNFMQRCSQLEHACLAKERTLQKLQDKVRESMVKEDRHRVNDKDVYEKLKHKVASAQHTNGEVLEPNFLQRDLKPAQIVGIYERQKVTLETEISNLRAENAQLCREICEKENIILNKVLGTEETKKALELLSRKQQSEIDEKVKEICRLEEELKERPTMEEVEETISSATRQEEASRQLNDRAPDESYIENILQQICQLLELEDPSFIVRVPSPVVSYSSLWCNGRYDGEMKRLLSALVQKEGIQSLILLYENDFETLESLLVLVSAVPRMEQFVSDVCDVVFCDGHSWSLPSDADNGINRTPEAVPGILKSWIQRLEETSELFSLKDTLVQMLWERANKDSEPEPEMNDRLIIGCVKNLIDVEQDYLTTKASYSDAEAMVKAEPNKLLQRIVAHFEMLFEVPKLEGVMAVMNSVYIKCTEYHNFARALSSMLGLNKEEGPNTIISAVNSIMSNGRL